MMTLPAPLSNDVSSTDPAERVRLARMGTNHVLYSPDGTLVATSDVRLNIEVRREETVLFRANYESDNPKIRSSERVRGLAFSSDGRTLWIASGDTVRAVEIESGEVWWQFTPARSFGFLISSPSALAVSERGDIGLAFDNGSLAFVPRPTPGDRQSFPVWKDNETPRHLAFTHGGERLVGVDNFCIVGWDTQTHKKTLRIPVIEKVYGSAIHPSKPFVITRHLSSAELWDTNSKSVIGRFPVKIGLPLAAFHPTKPWIALGSHNEVEIFSFEGELVRRFEVSDAYVVSFGFSPTGNELAVGCSDQILRRFAVFG